MEKIGIFGDVEVLLDYTRRVGEERPVGADAAAIFIGLRDIVGADCDQPAIGNLELAMEFHQSFCLPAVLGTETSTAKHQNHRVSSLQLGELPVFPSVVGKLIVGKDTARNHVRSHR